MSSTQNNSNIPATINGWSSAAQVREEAEVQSSLQVESEVVWADDRVQVGTGVASNDASGSRNMASSSCREQQPLSLGRPRGEVMNSLLSNQTIRISGEPGQSSRSFSSGAMTPIEQLRQYQQQQQNLRHQLAQGNYAVERKRICDIAIGALEEVEKLSRMGEPMWIPDNIADNNTHQLNEEEYFRANFPFGVGPRPANLLCEGTRHSTMLAMGAVSIVDIFMNLTQFKSVFNAIVSRTMTLEVLEVVGETTGNYRGSMQLISIEMQMLSQLIPVRRSVLARYCRQLGEGKWGVVDISIDTFRPIHLVKFRKRPSGCIIEDLPNGFSKVTWVEHVEVQELDIHPLFRPLVVSGYAFGAKRWLGILERQTDRLVSVLSQALPFRDIVLTDMRSKRVINRMAERMVASYNVGAGAGTEEPWISIAENVGANRMKIFMQRNVDQPGRPIGVALCTTVSFWLPAPPMIVFEYIRDPERRHEMDVIISDGRIDEISRVVIGRDNANGISLIRNSETNMLILQEANWDPMGAYLIYAPVDVNAMDLVLGGGGDADNVALLPSGFVVFPDGPNTNGRSSSTHGGVGGSLVTVSYQLLIDPCPASEDLQDSVPALTNLVTNIIDNLVAYFNARRLTLSFV